MAEIMIAIGMLIALRCKPKITILAVIPTPISLTNMMRKSNVGEVRVWIQATYRGDHLAPTVNRHFKIEGLFFV